jgi:hypothetical protein
MRRTAFGILVAICLANLSGLVRNPVIASSAQEPCTPSPVDLSGIPEVHGTAANAELWALIFRSVPFHAEQEVKIVWRMTGSGDFKIYAEDSNGNGILPIWGPEAHGGSTWKRPGDEWGTGFIFPTSGCWTIKVRRDSASGEVRFFVKYALKLI